MHMEKRLKLLAVYLGISAEEEGEILELALGRADEIIKNYCRLTVIPEGLLFTSVAMAADLYRAEEPGKKEVTGAIRRIEEGEVAISFDSYKSTSEDKALSLMRNSTAQRTSVLRNYAEQLNRYRRCGF